MNYLLVKNIRLPTTDSGSTTVTANAELLLRKSFTYYNSKSSYNYYYYYYYYLKGGDNVRRVESDFQSEDPSPTIPTIENKDENWKIVEDKKESNS